MSRGLILPRNYTIRLARNRTDRWAVYKLLILEREEEPCSLLDIYIHPYYLLVFFRNQI